MLRILHTGDWHIGRTLNGWARRNEHAVALAEIERIIVERQIDALIVAGDIFDSMAPSADARGMFYGAMDRMHARRPGLSSIVIAGNHDHAGQLEAPSVLLQRLGTRVVGTLRQVDGRLDARKHHVVLKDATGCPRACVLVLPFLGVGDIPRIAPEECTGSAIVEGVRRLHQSAIADARAASDGLPLIVTGHLTLAGSAESEISERRILVGGEHAVPHDIFPPTVAYAALGHLHRPQWVGRTTVRYAGSLFPLSASERDYEHGVSVVSIDPTGGVAVEHLPLARPVPFIRLPASGALERSAIADAFRELSLDPQLATELRPFVHVAVKVNGTAAGIRGEVDEIAGGFPVRVAAPPEIVRSCAIEQAGNAAGTAPPQLKDIDPLDLFTQAFVACHQVAPAEIHLRAFAAAREEV
jgi:DNA repair protein SbcD/Mre11